MGYLPEGVIEGHSVDYISVLIQGEQFLARIRIPDFASTIIAACNKLASTFVEGAICKWQQMRSQHFEETKALLHIFLLFFNKFFDQLFQLWLASFRNEGLFEQDLINKSIDVSSVK